MTDQPRTVHEALAILANTDPEDIRKAALQMGIGMQEAAYNLASAFREVHSWEAMAEEFSVLDDAFATVKRDDHTHAPDYAHNAPEDATHVHPPR